MVITADEMIDRRQLRRKVSFWRAIAFVILAVSLIALLAYSARNTLFSSASSDHIARVKITGVITNDEPMLNLLKQIKDQDKIKAVILNISSPGGSTVGGEAMYEAVRELAEKKPVVTQVGTLAASAGYMIASATDHIVARRSSIVGSIGVLFQYADASELMGKIGVQVKAIKSSPLKAEPDPFSPTPPEAIEMLDRLIQDSYEWFVSLVEERRGMDRQEVLKLADGSVFSGGQGLENGLIDAIGGEETARKWLTEEKKIRDDFEIVEYKPKRPGDSLFDNPAALVKIARVLGFEISSINAIELQNAVREHLLLDGLVSIWQSPK